MDLETKIKEVSSVIAEKILEGKDAREVARISQDEIDVVLFPHTQAIEDNVDSLISEAISIALKKVVVAKDSMWWE